MIEWKRAEERMGQEVGEAANGIEGSVHGRGEREVTTEKGSWNRTA